MCVLFICNINISATKNLRFAAVALWNSNLVDLLYCRQWGIPSAHWTRCIRCGRSHTSARPAENSHTAYHVGQKYILYAWSRRQDISVRHDGYHFRRNNHWGINWQQLLPSMTMTKFWSRRHTNPCLGWITQKITTFRFLLTASLSISRKDQPCHRSV